MTAPLLALALLLTGTPSPAPKPVPKPAPPPAIEGTVRGPGGKPVKGAVIVVRHREAERSWSLPDPPITVRTDGQGRFRAVIDTLRTVEVRVQAEGLAPKILGSARSGQPLDILLEKGRALAGLVRDASSGKPVAGASVEAWPGVWQPRDALDEEASGVRKASTDARGRFRVDGLGAATVTVVVRSPGHAVLRRSAPAGTRLDLLLLRGLSIAGFVRDPKGGPIAGATVQAEADLVRDPLPATTNALGQFEIAGVDDRPYRVWAHRSGGGTSPIEAVTVPADADARLDLVIPASSDVVGRLVSEGPKPVTGTVVVTELDGLPSRLLSSFLRSVAAADGRFRLSGLPPGSHALAVSAPGFGMKRLEVVVAGAEPTDLGDIELERGLLIRGRVQDAASLPITGARIRSHFADNGRLGPEALSDADGSFTLAGLEEGAYTLIASSAGFGETRREVPTGTQDATITLHPGGTISGQVVDLKGIPVEAFSVSARTTHREEGLVAVKAPANMEDPNGRFTIDDLPEGTYAVEVFADGKRPGWANDVVVKPGSIVDVGRIRLEPGGIVRGVVVDARGAPVASARVSARGPGLSRYATDPETASDLDGSFELRGAALGAVDVHASHPDFATGKAAGVVVEPEAPATARVVLTAGGRIEGHARRRDGSGIPGAYVYVQSLTMGAQGYRDFIAVAPDDGSFLAEHVPPGRASIALMMSTGDAFTNRRSKQADVVEGETELVEFAAPEILVSGRVTRSGQPLPGVRVAVGSGGNVTYSTGSLAPPTMDGPFPGYAKTQPDGSYALLADEPGKSWVSVESLDRHRKYLERRVEIPDGDSFALDLAIAGTSVAGVVVDKETGEPLHQAWVLALRSSGQPLDTNAGPDGRFEIDLDPGDYKLQAVAPGHAKQSINVAVTASGTPDLRFTLARGGMIEGKVVDAAGRPVPGLQISAFAGKGMDFESTQGFQSLSDGSFVVERLGDRPYTLFAGSELVGFGLAPNVAAGTSGVLLSLQPGGRVRATVRDAEGVPAAGAKVRVDQVGGVEVVSHALSCSTSAEGQCEIATPQGHVLFWASRSSAHGSLSVDVPAQSLAEIQVSLSPAAH